MNAYFESFNGRLSDKVLNAELFDTIPEAKVLVDCWRLEYNTFRQRRPGNMVEPSGTHSSPGRSPPGPEAVAGLAQEDGMASIGIGAILGGDSMRLRGADAPHGRSRRG